MNLLQAPFPHRPVKVTPPGSRLVSQLGALAWAAVIIAGALLMVVPPAIDLVRDIGIGQSAQRVSWARLVRGSCSTHVLLVSCEAELVARPPQGAEVRRKVDYLFVDFHFGAYTLAVLADAALPPQLTTDLGQGKLWGRTITLVLAAPLFLAIAALVFVLVPGALRERRRLGRSLSQGELRATMLRVLRREHDEWTLVPHPAGAPGSERSWPMTGWPIFIDPGQGLVLGVTSGDGTLAMPLDGTLSALDLTAEERRRLIDWIGPQRIAWRPVADQVSTLRRSLRKIALPLLVVALTLGAAAGALVWFNGQGPRVGDYILVDMKQPASSFTGKVRLEGVIQNQLRVQSTWSDAQATHLEEYRPMTRVGWQRGEPVQWLVKEVSVAKPVAEPATRRGTAVAAPLPADAMAGLARLGVTLAPHATTLVVEPEPPSDMSTQILSIVLGGVAAVLLLIAALGFAFGRR